MRLTASARRWPSARLKYPLALLCAGLLVGLVMFALWYFDIGITHGDEEYSCRQCGAVMRVDAKYFFYWRVPYRWTVTPGPNGSHWWHDWMPTASYRLGWLDRGCRC